MSKNHKNNAYSLVDEHTTTYENPFKFSAKELDDITGLYDHGARSRNSVSTLWYGVDPLFEKYPDFSPYNYCAGNPVKLVDLDGRVIRKDGKILFTVEKENSWCFYESTTIENGCKQGLAFRAKKGYIYLNNGKAIEAYQTNGTESIIYKVTIDNDGKELYSEPVLDDMNPNYNCTGKLVERNFIIDASLISLDDLIDIEGYVILNSNEKPQYGDIGIYVNKDNKQIIHYEFFLDNKGRVDAKGGIENYNERSNGGTDSSWENTIYIRLRLNKQNQDAEEN